MKTMVVVFLVGMMLTNVTITGCGSSPEVQNTTTTQTYGQELLDLKKAYDEGAISEKEYNSAKKAMKKKYE